MAQSILRSTFTSQSGLLGRGRGLGANHLTAEVPSTVVPVLRSGLVLGCAAAIAMAAWLGDPGGYLQGDPALARLLRGMALIKGLIALAAMGAVFWRLAWPISKPVAAGYFACCWAFAGSTMLIWKLSCIVPAALLFHTAALSMLWVGWRER